MAMTNTTLTLLGSTFTNSASPNTNYAYSNPLIISQSYSSQGECKTILQFSISNVIKSSKINSAALNFNLKILGVTGNGLSKVTVKHSAAVTNGYVYSSVTHNNFNSLVAQSAKESTECKAGQSNYNSNQIDVTSSIANNMQDGILTIVLESLYIAMEIDPNSITVSVNYEEVEPIVPTITSPNGTYENRSNDIKFEWIYKSQTEATQASATIEYRHGTSGVYTTVNVYSSNNYYVMSANTLYDGIYEWRVRTTDTDGKTSDYSYGSFTVIDRPSVPIITKIDNKCISTITWSSTDQIAFEIQVYKGDVQEYSKKVSSSANNYNPNMFFSSNTYTIKLRVCNIYGLWSEWGNKIVTFTFTNPPKPTVTVTTKNYDVVIKSNVIGAFVYKSEDKRDYIPVGKIGENYSFMDYNVADSRMYRYYVRSYENGYTDSDIQLAQVSIKGVMLQNDKGYVKLRLSQNMFMDYNKSISAEKVINKYSGRQYGVAEFGDYRECSISLSVALTQDELNDLNDLYFNNEILVYKDFRGNKFYCVIENINITQIISEYYNVDLVVHRVDETEEVSVYE